MAGRKPTETGNLDIDQICGMLINGSTLSAAAEKLGVLRETMVMWLARDETRSAKAREARALSAELWDQKAEEVIAAAKAPELFGQFHEMTRARELAHHYRWRAAKISPQYRDKIAHVGDAGEDSIKMDMTHAKSALLRGIIPDTSK